MRLFGDWRVVFNREQVCIGKGVSCLSFLCTWENTFRKKFENNLEYEIDVTANSVRKKGVNVVIFFFFVLSETSS